MANEILVNENNEVLVDNEQVLSDVNTIGTFVNVNGEPQAEVNFSSDPQTQIDKKLDKTQCTLDFNQLFDASKSTLPSGSGLVISNIYGGHHIEGTTTGQFYHKMYSVSTISGHKYYFAANFSEKANVYIVAKAGSTSFNTKDEKIFVGDTNFNITLQVERDKTISTDLKPILIDLTRMFGVGKEPQTEQEVQEYLVKGTYYPYDDKPSRDEVNSLSMCLSDTIDNNVFVGDNYYYAPSNGYAYVVLTGTHNLNNANLINDTKGFSLNVSAITAGGSGRILMPVSKGDRLWVQYDTTNIVIEISKFIHAKEI